MISFTLDIRENIHRVYVREYKYSVYRQVIYLDREM